MEMCPCGSGETYSNCCHVFISGEKSAPTAEALMRSRYTAYTKSELGYIERTMKGRALLRFDKQKSETRASNVKWDRLEILKTSQQNNRHFVEFIAYLSVNDQHETLHERSEFLFENDQWYYIDGEMFPEKLLNSRRKTGRNEPCSCGSQKKFKKCCAIKTSNKIN